MYGVNRVIDREQTLEVIDRMVEKRGAEYVYPRREASRDDFATEEEFEDWVNTYGDSTACHYRWTTGDHRSGELHGQDLPVGEPACLVGAVLAEFDLLDQTVPDPDGSMNEQPVGELELGRWFTRDAVVALRRAQASQDAGHTWGSAAKRAREKDS